MPDSIIPRGHHPDDIIWRFDRDWVVDSGYDESGFNTKSPQVQGVWGHYYDAGDWDAYPSHITVPMHLMLLYDLAPGGFHNGDVGNRYQLHEYDEWIDEGQNGIPDLLDETVWLLNYYKRARHVLKEYGGTGGVPGYTGRDAIPYENSITIQGGEFTVHQQMNHMIFAMGYINAMANTSSTPFTLEPRPEVSLNLIDGEQFCQSGFYLTVNASENTRRVEYYYGWRFIGESSDKEDNFRLFWKSNLDENSEVLITAVAYSDRGRRSLHSAAGESRIIISGIE